MLCIRCLLIYYGMQLVSLVCIYSRGNDFITDQLAITDSDGKWMYYCVNNTYISQGFNFTLQICPYDDKYFDTGFIAHANYTCKKHFGGVICPLPLYDSLRDLPRLRLVGHKEKMNEISIPDCFPDLYYCDWESIKPRITSVEQFDEKTIVGWDFQAKLASIVDVKSTVFYYPKGPSLKNTRQGFQCSITGFMTNSDSLGDQFDYEKKPNNSRFPPKCQDLTQPNDKMSNMCTFSKYFSLPRSCVKFYTVCVELSALDCKNSYIACKDKAIETNLFPPKLSCAVTRPKREVYMQWEPKASRRLDERYRYTYELYERDELIKRNTTEKSIAYFSVPNIEAPLTGRIKVCTDDACMCSDFSEARCSKEGVLHSNNELPIYVISLTGGTLGILCVVSLLFVNKMYKKKQTIKNEETFVIDSEELLYTDTSYMVINPRNDYEHINYVSPLNEIFDEIRSEYNAAPS